MFKVSKAEISRILLCTSLPPVCLIGMVIIFFYHINWWCFITEMERVYCTVCTGFLMLLRLMLVPAGHKSHATDLWKALSSPSHNVHAVCSLAVQWDRSTSWISVWLTAPAVPVVRQLTVSTLFGVSDSEEQTASILQWQSGSGSCWTSWERLCPLIGPSLVSCFPFCASNWPKYSPPFPYIRHVFSSQLLQHHLD